MGGRAAAAWAAAQVEAEAVTGEAWAAAGSVPEVGAVDVLAVAETAVA